MAAVPPTTSEGKMAPTVWGKNGRLVVNSPGCRESSLAQVCSDALSHVAVHVHQSCDGGLAHLDTDTDRQTHSEKGVHTTEAGFVTTVKRCSLKDNSCILNIEPLSGSSRMK